MSVARAQREISSAELSEWMAYNRLDPFGEDRADLRAGIVASAVSNPFRSAGADPFVASDFIPTFGEEPTAPEPMSQTEIESRLKLFATAMTAGANHG